MRESIVVLESLIQVHVFMLVNLNPRCRQPLFTSANHSSPTPPSKPTHQGPVHVACTRHITSYSLGVCYAVPLGGSPTTTTMTSSTSTSKRLTLLGQGRCMLRHLATNALLVTYFLGPLNNSCLGSSPLDRCIPVRRTCLPSSPPMAKPPKRQW